MVPDSPSNPVSGSLGSSSPWMIRSQRDGWLVLTQCSVSCLHGALHFQRTSKCTSLSEPLKPPCKWGQDKMAMAIGKMRPRSLEAHTSPLCVVPFALCHTGNALTVHALAASAQGGSSAPQALCLLGDREPQGVGCSKARLIRGRAQGRGSGLEGLSKEVTSNTTARSGDRKVGVWLLSGTGK